jgi:hypothetical protein
LSLIGILPASGKATRFFGLPKFLLPIDEEGRNLLDLHISMMDEVCDEIRISTSERWFNLLARYQDSVNLYKIEPSTMNDAVYRMTNNCIDQTKTKFIIGMPDTFFTDDNPYKKLFESLDTHTELTLACFKMQKHLKGKVGQVKLNFREIESVIDKEANCNYPWMWGAIMCNFEFIKKLNLKNQHPGIDLSHMNLNGLNYTSAKINGSYIDAGTLSGYKKILDFKQKSFN